VTPTPNGRLAKEDSSLEVAGRLLQDSYNFQLDAAKTQQRADFDAVEASNDLIVGLQASLPLTVRWPDRAPLHRLSWTRPSTR
jgi:hypothetical protein